MARAKNAIQVETPLYERDFCLWVEEQARLLKEGRLEQLDLVNLIDEIEDLGIHEKKAVESNLVVVLKHLLKHQYQPRRRSRSWLSSIAEHRRRLRSELATSPSLRPYARDQFEECYQDGRHQALIETGLAPDALPSAPLLFPRAGPRPGVPARLRGVGRSKPCHAPGAVPREITLDDHLWRSSNLAR